MASLSSNALEIALRIKADSSQAETELKKFKNELKGLDKASKDSLAPLERLAASAGLSADKFNTLKTGALAAVAGIGAIVGVAAATGTALFKLASSAAEFGGAIFDASEKTGLSAQTLSALKFAADQSGSSLEAITNATAKFAKVVGDAADGSDEATAKLKKFGVEPQDAINNLDGALSKVFKTIVEAKPGVEQLALAQLAFGRSGAELLPTLKSFDGDMAKLIATAKALGLTLSDEDAKAADEFGDNVQILEDQLGALSRTIGREVLPVFNKMAKDFSGFLKENQGLATSWATAVANAIGKIGEAARQEQEDIQALGDTLELFIKDPVSLFTGAVRDRADARRKAREDAIRGAVIAPPIDYSRPQDVKAKKDLFGGKESDDRQKEADKARKDREALAKRDADAVLKLGSNVLDTLNDQFQKAYDKLLDGLAGGQSTDAFKANVQDLISWYNEKFLENSGKLEKLELESAKREGATKNEIQLLQDKQLDRQVDMADRISKIREASNKAEVKTVEEKTKTVEEGVKKDIAAAKQSADAQIAIFRAQSATQIAQKEFELSQRLISEQNYAKQVGQIRLEILQKERGLTGDLEKQKILDEEIKQQKIANSIAVIEAIDKETEAIKKQNEEKQRASDLEDEKAKKRFRQSGEDAELDRLKSTVGSGFENDGFRELTDFFAGEGNTAAIAGLEALQQAFSAVGQAVGETVQAFVLYGNAGKSVRQITALILASIAQQAAIQAVYELAQGFAKLAMAFFGVPNAGPSATAHFTAAAIYGSIAGIAAVAGRAVAGDSFKQNTTASGAVASSTSGSGGTGQAQRDTSGQGQIFSTKEDSISNFNQPNSAQGGLKVNSVITLRIADDSTFLGRMLKADIENGGTARQQIRLIMDNG